MSIPREPPVIVPGCLRVAFGANDDGNRLPGRKIPLRTFADWNRPPTVFLQSDLVAHRSDSIRELVVSTSVVADIYTDRTQFG